MSVCICPKNAQFFSLAPSALAKLLHMTYPHNLYGQKTTLRLRKGSKRAQIRARSALTNFEPFVEGSERVFWLFVEGSPKIPGKVPGTHCLLRTPLELYLPKLGPAISLLTHRYRQRARPSSFIHARVLSVFLDPTSLDTGLLGCFVLVVMSITRPVEYDWY